MQTADRFSGRQRGGLPPVRLFRKQRSSEMTATTDWQAKQYVLFENERTRPVRDLLAAVPATDVRMAIDLGCGPGNSTEVLAAHAPSAAISGLDSSGDMIAAARKRLPQLQFDT